MYKKLLVVTAGALSLMACSSTPAPQDNNQATHVTTKCEVLTSKPGGWQQVSITPQVTEAATTAVASIDGSHSLKEIQSATEQVVAGMNYRINFTTEDDTAYVAVVYRNLKSEYKVVSLMSESEVADCK